MTTITRRWPLNTRTEPIARSRALSVTLWLTQIASAGLFLLAGSLKLAGAAPMVQMFDTIGVGQWFRYVTGSIEVLGAILLLVPSLALFSSLVLAATMAGAITAHLFVIGGNPAIPAVLLAAMGFVAWTRWSEH